MDRFDVCAALVIIVVILVAGIAFAERAWNGPIAAEEATEYCRANGYDIWKNYERIPFTTKALGIRCDWRDRDRRDIAMDVDEATPIIVG